MNCPREHCSGLLVEEDGKWMKCSACARPITKVEAMATQKEETTMAKPTDKCPAKYCRNDAATCEKHARGGGGTSKPSPARGLKKTARRPQAATAPASSNGHGDALNSALLAVVESEEQQLLTRLDKLKHVKEAIAAL